MDQFEYVMIPIGISSRDLRVQLGMGLLFLVVQVWQMFNDHPFLGSQLSGG